MRWIYLKQRLKEIGTGVVISQGTVFEFPANISVGNRVFVGRDTIVTGRTRIVIGDDTLIGPHVIINSGNHVFADHARLVSAQGYDAKEILIGRDVWVGAAVVILAGSTLGDGCIVGAGSVVRGVWEPYSVVAGVPARLLKTR